MKLLLDMNMSRLFLPWLHSAGYHAIHWSSIGEPTAPDKLILEYAAENEFVVLTSDLDFGSILSATQVFGPSVVLVRPHFAKPEDIIRQILLALKTSAFELEDGALVIVEANRIRVRPLPM